MINIYLAGPFFSEEQINRITAVEKHITKNPQALQVYSPRLHQDGHAAPQTAEWAREIFDRDMAALEQADVVLAILDYQGGITDPGTAFEIGAAYRMNKTIVVYHEQKTPVNIMLTESTQAYLTSLSALETYDFKQKKRIAYVGEFI